MSIQSVRLDKETEQLLELLQDETDLTVSEVLRRGVKKVYREWETEQPKTPYDIYAQLDLGEGGHALAPSSDPKPGLDEALKDKHRTG